MIEEMVPYTKTMRGIVNDNENKLVVSNQIEDFSCAPNVITQFIIVDAENSIVFSYKNECEQSDELDTQFRIVYKTPENTYFKICSTSYTSPSPLIIPPDAAFDTRALTNDAIHIANDARVSKDAIRLANDAIRLANNASHLTEDARVSKDASHLTDDTIAVTAFPKSTKQKKKTEKKKTRKVNPSEYVGFY